MVSKTNIGSAIKGTKYFLIIIIECGMSPKPIFPMNIETKHIIITITLFSFLFLNKLHDKHFHHFVRSKLP